jgi:hypothetical protein
MSSSASKISNTNEVKGPSSRHFSLRYWRLHYFPVFHQSSVSRQGIETLANIEFGVMRKGVWNRNKTESQDTGVVEIRSKG